MNSFFQNIANNFRLFLNPLLTLSAFFLLFIFVLISRLPLINAKYATLQKNTTLIKQLSTRQKILSQTSRSKIQDYAVRLEKILPPTMDIISLHNAVLNLSKKTGINILTSNSPQIDNKQHRAQINISFTTPDDISIFLQRVELQSGKLVILESISFDKVNREYQAQLTFPFYEEPPSNSNSNNLIDQNYLDEVLKLAE